MYFFDKKIKGNALQYILQCMIAASSIGIALLYMDIVLETTIVASIGATSFIIFTMPHTYRARPKYILGGYVVCTFVGIMSQWIAGMGSGLSNHVIAAFAVGLAMLLMVVTDTEHPPAAAFALSIAIDGFTLDMIVFVFAVTIFLLFIKRLLSKWLIDLL